MVAEENKTHPEPSYETVLMWEPLMREFNEVVDYLEYWRNKDQEDKITMSRSSIIYLLEGINKICSDNGITRKDLSYTYGTRRRVG